MQLHQLHLGVQSILHQQLIVRSSSATHDLPLQDSWYCRDLNRSQPLLPDGFVPHRNDQKAQRTLFLQSMNQAHSCLVSKADGSLSKQRAMAARCFSHHSISVSA
jgi:hypothetical protein